MSVLHDLEQHPTSLFSSLLNDVSMDRGRAVVLNVVSSSLAQPVYQEFASLRPPLGGRTRLVNVKNFHGSLTTVVRAQNDTTKTANITDRPTIFISTLV